MTKTAPVENKKKFDISVPRLISETLIQDLTMVLDKHHIDEQAVPALDFKVKWLRQSLLSKYSDSGTATPKERKLAAIKKWQSMEIRNSVTNERLLFDNCYFGDMTSEKIVQFARAIIRSMIGETYPSDVLLGEFSNGASTRVKRGPVAIAQKFVGKAHVTPEGWDAFRKGVLPYSTSWVQSYMDGTFSPVHVDGSVMFTVPKNSEIDRVACKEPELNMFMQRGVGNYFRNALLKRNINLNDQTVNQRLAREGSIGRKLATLDLSSASDLISTQLVYLLLPLDWFLLLDSIRVKRTKINGEYHELSMFSSMGNGFTFELESLLFYALSCAINQAWKIRGRVSIFGDDIITPTAIAPMYGRVFSWFGFKVNTKKSFWRGRFRESCGKHYYDGSDVTPFNIHKPIVTLPDLILTLNKLRKWATEKDCDISFWSANYFCVWDHYKNVVPWFLRGGKDLESSTSLVTLDPPRKMISSFLRDVETDQLGAYLQWLQSAGRREIRLHHLQSPCYADRAIRNREITLLWLQGAGADKPFEPSKASVEIGHKLIRNRTWERTLHTENRWWEEKYV